LLRITNRWSGEDLIEDVNCLETFANGAPIALPDAGTGNPSACGKAGSIAKLRGKTFPCGYKDIVAAGLLGKTYRDPLR